MFRSCYFDSKRNKIHLWEQINGQNLYNTVDWIPYVFVKSNNGEIKTIYGEQVIKKTFNSYYDYNEFCKSTISFEDKVKPEIQFLSERYSSVPDEEMIPPQLKMFFIDIEVYVEDTDDIHSWKPEKADGTVVLISVYDNIKNKTTVFGIHPYKGKYHKEKFIDYFECKSEENLLISFFNFIGRNNPDVISGWNISQYDLPYLINRIKNQFGEDSNIYNKLSPIGVVRMWERDGIYNINIAGVNIIDYMELYKWYAPNKLESYSLDFVSRYELDKGKVDYSEYKDLKRLYNENWDLYVTYNIIDSLRVGQLEEKLGYIKQVQSLSLLTRVPMMFYKTVTNLLEGLLLVYLRRNNMCAPHLYGGSQEGYEGAYVKDPEKGLHEWVVDLDIVSSYPTAMITMNMSLETYFGRIQGMDEQTVIEYTKKRSFPSFTMYREGQGKVLFSDKKLETFNKALEKRLICISPCGACFSTKPAGVIATVERELFWKRVEMKDKMKRLKSSLSELRDDNLKKSKEKVAQLHNLQNAYKTMLNSMYGATAVPYSRWYNKSLSEAVTSCARNTIKMGVQYVNELLNNPNDKLLKVLEEIKG